MQRKLWKIKVCDFSMPEFEQLPVEDKAHDAATSGSLK